ncbi:hypothetical protein SAMN04487948_105139 [Halogranum amylolyticum]|uniref:DUF2795 domain-containing protein n=1 Tax=Halogranum amylolyticum TaxID=660520 RepID=A0A1H8SKF5_9EURY|nr:hypothetical protein [Halogranum amylolyticum]SEO78748.1 hypothetical protein SAMN04487948_105139 [Halogranum amylolyticum]
MNTVKLSRVESLFETLQYPVSREEAAAEFSDTRVQLADGEANLGELVSDARAESFHNPDELYAELNNTLPIEAVGEPGQSEGDA